MVENTLNIGKISEGFVLDHIKAKTNTYLHIFSII